MDFQWKRKTHWRILGIRRPGQASILRPPPPQPRWRRMISELEGGGGGHSGAKLFHQFAKFVISFVQGRPGRWWPSKFSRICERALFNFDCSKCCFWLYFDNFALLLTLNKYWIARASTVASERFWNFTRKKCYVSIFFRNFPKRLGDIGTDRSPPHTSFKSGEIYPSPPPDLRPLVLSNKLQACFAFMFTKHAQNTHLYWFACARATKASERWKIYSLYDTKKLFYSFFSHDYKYSLIRGGRNAFLKQ